MINSRIVAMFKKFRDGSKEEIQLPKKPQWGSGAEAYFIKLNNGNGLKLYKEEDHAKRTCKRQKDAYKLGVAPAVRSGVFGVIVKTSGWKKARQFWAYQTQVVETDPCNDCRDSECHDCKLSFNKRFTCKAEEDLRRSLKKVGMYGGDLHHGNIGVMKGKFVCIDFGDLS